MKHESATTALVSMLFLISVPAEGNGVEGKYHTWTSRTGSTVEAAFVDAVWNKEKKTNVVTLKRRDGLTVNVELGDLSEASQELARRLKGAAGKAESVRRVSKGAAKAERSEVTPDEDSTSSLDMLPVVGHARVVELTAKVEVVNPGNVSKEKFQFLLTIPASNLRHQRLLDWNSDMEHLATETHANGIDKYLSLAFSVPAGEVVKHEVRFRVLVVPVDYSRLREPSATPPLDHPTIAKYLEPSRNIESDSGEVRQLANRLFANRRTILEKAKAAYEWPAKNIKYEVQQEALGAREAILRGVGDCTDFAATFVALCRCGKIPARRATVFNMGTDLVRTVKLPNHDAAELFLEGYGWVPVDPILGQGKYDKVEGFARTGNSLVFYKREGAWTYSGSPTVDCSVNWLLKAVDQGPWQDLLRRYRPGAKKTS